MANRGRRFNEEAGPDTPGPGTYNVNSNKEWMKAGNQMDPQAAMAANFSVGKSDGPPNGKQASGGVSALSRTTVYQ